jgi:hypothetical protein
MRLWIWIRETAESIFLQRKVRERQMVFDKGYPYGDIHVYELRESIEVGRIEKEIAFQAVMAFSCSTLSVPFRPIRSCFSPLNVNA